jgi:hypothetical protein
VPTPQTEIDFESLVAAGIAAVVIRPAKKRRRSWSNPRSSGKPDRICPAQPDQTAALHVGTPMAVSLRSNTHLVGRLYLPNANALNSASPTRFARAYSLQPGLSEVGK